tara:strand:+ start:907 stop:1047 length:141 start_codon:yes stop_codon:yes gene_type:complete
VKESEIRNNKVLKNYQRLVDQDVKKFFSKKKKTFKKQIINPGDVQM